jgi:hypothetical protein
MPRALIGRRLVGYFLAPVVMRAVMLASKGEGSQAQILHLIPIQWRLRPLISSQPLDSRGLL